MYKYFLFFLFFTILLKGQDTVLDIHFNSDFYKNQWVGFYLFDPVEKKEVYNYQGEKYFIPASNTKILTLYTGLKMLQDSIPSLRYITDKDSLYIAGTGDPSLLESYFKERKVISFLQNSPLPIALYLNNFNDTKYGPGWSWEDYPEYFSPERGPFPIYGNIVTIYSPTQAVPSYFVTKIKKEKQNFPRELLRNVFYTTSSKKMEIPFITSDTLIKKILELEIDKPITLTKSFPKGKSKILYSIPSDSLFRRMMLVSDNFLAEQILILASNSVADKLSSKATIDYMLKTHLKDLPQKPKWVDGSGLSRYNTITPQDLVFILNNIYQEYPFERVKNLFAIGGVNGTLKNSYKGKTPYIFAKTGSMSGVYNLSGYLTTNSGKILIFSFMNNNFTTSFPELKKQIEKVLLHIKDNY